MEYIHFSVPRWMILSTELFKEELEKILLVDHKRFHTYIHTYGVTMECFQHNLSGWNLESKDGIRGSMYVHALEIRIKFNSILPM